MWLPGVRNLRLPLRFSKRFQEQHNRKRYSVRELRQNLIGPLGGPVAWRIVITNPNFACSASRYSATHLLGACPNDLCVMPANSAAAVRAVIIVLGIRGPLVDHLRRRCSRTSDLEQVFTVSRVRAMSELLTCQESIGPIL